MKIALPAAMLGLAAGSVLAAPVTYQVDPSHTYPSFAADHFGGLSVWRGKFDSSSGTIVLDKEAQHRDRRHHHRHELDRLRPREAQRAREVRRDVRRQKYPTATYKGTLTNFKNGAPTEVQGELTLHGVTRPLNLTINSFMCKMTPMAKKERCGADASATFERSDFGINYGDKYGFNMDVKLAIQVEATPTG